MNRKWMVISIILAALMCLTSCKSEEVKAVEASIDALGEITTSSETAVVAAEEQYILLSNDDKEKVENYGQLTLARNQLDDLLVAEIEDSISAIGEVTAESEETVSEIEKRYNELNSTNKERISNYDVLLQARIELDNCLIVREAYEKIADASDEDYYQFYTDNVSGNSERIEKLDTLIADSCGSFYDAYNNGEITVDVAETVLERFADVYTGQQTKVSSVLNSVTMLEKSKGNYENGLAAIEDGDYIAASEYLGEVSSKDTNHESAKQLIEQYKEDCISQILQEASRLSESRGSDHAVDYLRECYYPMDLSIREAKEQYRSAYVSECITSCIQLCSSGQFDEWKSDYIHMQDYQTENELRTAYEYVELMEKISCYEVVQSYLPLVTKTYDVVDNDWMLLPYGLTTSNTISWNRHICPVMFVTEDSVTLVLFVGFLRNSWLFFDEIDFSCDGTLAKNIEFDHFDVTRNILSGGIAEATAIYHSDIEFPSLYAFDLEGLIGDIISSDTTIIRFTGSGYEDYTISTAEKNNLENFWGLYSALEDYPEFIDLSSDELADLQAQSAELLTTLQQYI